jgi:dihydroflavonol-4-reductase
LTAPVFVTGGSGFVGREIVRRLVGDGRSVVALARSSESAAAVTLLGAGAVLGDLFDEVSLVRGISGCEVVYHAAGVNAFCLRDASPMFRTNVDGTVAVVEAAARAGARRVVYTSSAAAIGEAAETIGHERSGHRGWFLSNYERSKFEGERAALERGRELGIEVVCVCPASVQGPGRTHGTARLLLDIVNGRLPAVVDSRLSIVDVRDCAEGHLLAEANGGAGERYLLCGASMTTGDALQLLAEVSQLELRTRFLPPRLALLSAGIVERLFRLRGRRPPVCRELVRTLLHGHAYDGSRAERELGLRYTPIRQSLFDTMRWYAENGYLRRGSVVF